MRVVRGPHVGFTLFNTISTTDANDYDSSFRFRPTNYNIDTGPTAVVILQNYLFNDKVRSRILL